METIQIETKTVTTIEIIPRNDFLSVVTETATSYRNGAVVATKPAKKRIVKSESIQQYVNGAREELEWANKVIDTDNHARGFYVYCSPAILEAYSYSYGAHNYDFAEVYGPDWAFYDGDDAVLCISCQWNGNLYNAETMEIYPRTFNLEYADDEYDLQKVKSILETHHGVRDISIDYVPGYNQNSEDHQCSLYCKWIPTAEQMQMVEQLARWEIQELKLFGIESAKLEK